MRGTALFTTQIAPLMVRLAPAGQMTRFQSLLVLVQLVPPAVLNGVLAWLATRASSLLALLPAAFMAEGAAVLLAATARRNWLPGRDDEPLQSVRQA